MSDYSSPAEMADMLDKIDSLEATNRQQAAEIKRLERIIDYIETYDPEIVDAARSKALEDTQ